MNLTSRGLTYRVRLENRFVDTIPGEGNCVMLMMLRKLTGIYSVSNITSAVKCFTCLFQLIFTKTIWDFFFICKSVIFKAKHMWSNASGMERKYLNYMFFRICLKCFFFLFYDYFVISILYLHSVNYAQIFYTERAT